MKKIQPQNIGPTLILQLILRIVLFCISGLIIVGDSSRYVVSRIFLLPYQLLKFISRKTVRFFSSLHNINKTFLSTATIFFRRIYKTLGGIKLPKLKKKSSYTVIKKPKKIKKVDRFSFLRLKIAYFIFGILFSVFIVSSIQGYIFFKSLPNPRLIGTLNFPVSTQIYDRKGRIIYEIFQDQNRTPIYLSDLSPYIYQASIAIEDKDFYNHGGVAIFGGVLRALKDMVLTGTLQGGSTITQQLVKSALLSPERTIDRKIKEIVLAIWTERLYTKNQILEMYLNQVPYGGPAYGIEEASKTYFGKDAKDLNLSEAALLAGLPQAPSNYSPYTDPELAKTRRDEVLLAMFHQKYISLQQYKQTLVMPIEIKPYSDFIRAPHFVFYVKSLLEKEYGFFQVGEGGLRVYTTLDLDVQERAETIINDELKKVASLNVGNGAAIITNPSTGEILAMVGSKDYFATPSGSFNVTTALRQPGSSIKPIMYSLGIEEGLFTAATVFDDSPVVFTSPGSSEVYRPVNYDGKFHGKVTLHTALSNSFNIPAVKALNIIGVSNFVNHARDMGISTFTDPSRYGLSMTLGGVEVKMTDMATAFGVFANAGNRTDLNPITKIADFKGNTLYINNSPSVKHVISADTAFIISNILSDNITRRQEFGFNSQLEIPGHAVSVKTGTTDDKRDNWTIGYTPNFLVAVWVGNNDNSPMNPYLASGITGAAPMWNKIMTYMLTDYEKNIGVAKSDTIPEPAGIIKKVCFGKTEYFIPGTENKVDCGQKASSPFTPTVFPYRSTQ